MLYFVLNIFSIFLACIPRKIALHFGKFLGFMLYYILPIRKKVAYINLKIAFPLKSDKEIKKIIKKSYMHYGLIMAEFIRNASANLKNSHYFLNAQTIEILKNNKSGLIFMTAHIGNWEILAPIISKYKKMAAIVRIQNNSSGNKFFYKARTYQNVEIISKKGSKKKMLKSLHNNAVLTLATDQNAKDKGIMIDFFGKPASFPKGAGHFHYLTKSKIVVGFCILDQSLNYVFNLEYLDIKDNIEQKDDIIVKVNEIYVKKLEKVILKHPEQYFWFHKKWDKNIYVS